MDVEAPYQSELQAALTHVVDAMEATSLPSEETPSSLYFERKADLLRVAAEALADEACRQIAILRRKQNTFSLMSRLPLEVLAVIFQYTLIFDDVDRKDRDYPFRYLGGLYALMQVSKGWAESVKGLPELWVVVDSRCPEQVWRGALIRSRPHPLQVRWHWDGKPDGEPRRRFEEAVFKHVDRWELVDLGDLRREGLHILETTEAPALKDLRLTCTDPVPSSPVNIFHGVAPQLRSLDSTKLPLFERSAVFSHLRSLRLTATIGSSLEGLMTILSLSLELERPELSYLALGNTTLVEPASHLPIRLSRLVSLRIVVDEPVASTVIRNLHIPACRNFLLVVRNGREDPGFIEASATVLEPAFRAVMAASRRLRIKASNPPGLSVLTSGDLGDKHSRTRDQQDIWITLPSSAALALLRVWIPQVLHDLSPLIVSTEVTLLSPLALYPGDISRLQGLESLTFRPDKYNKRISILGGYLEALAISLVGEDGRLRWPCPRLHTLRFINCRYESSSVLLQLAQGRTAAFEARAADSEDGEYVRLRVFEIVGSSPMDLSTFQKIQAVLGDAAKWTSDLNPLGDVTMQEN